MSPTARKALYAIGALALVVGVGSYGTTLLRDSRAEAARLKAVADQLRGESRMWHIVADSQQIIAEGLRARAARRDTVVMTRYRTMRDTLVIPDTCRAIVAFDDSTVAGLDSAYTDLQDAFLHEKEATAALSSQVLGLEHAYDSLSTAYDKATKPPHLSFLAKLKPAIGPGVFAGLCTSGTPCAGVGITLSWRF